MKRIVLAMAVLALGASVAFAGPNAGIMLNANGTDGEQTNSLGTPDPCQFMTFPPTCADAVPEATPDGTGLEWFFLFAARDGGMNFATMTFGVGPYDFYVSYLGAWGACDPGNVTVMVPGPNWPNPSSGIAVSWAPLQCWTAAWQPIFWLAFYPYQGGSQQIALGDFHSAQTAVVVDCDTGEEDPWADYAVLGYGDASGIPVCPSGEPEGACCIDTNQDGNPETCIGPITRAECEGQGGVYQGDGTTCGPDTCPPDQIPVGACCIDTNQDGNHETCIGPITMDDCMAQGGVYQGDGTVCGPNNEPCEPDEPPNPTQKSTWGAIKSIYR